MEQPVNHWCAVCGKGYFACDSCLQNTSFTPWRSLTCTAGHFQIFMVLQDYRNQRITRSEARELLRGNSLSGREDFKDSIKALLDEILCGDDLSGEGKSEAGHKSSGCVRTLTRHSYRRGKGHGEEIGKASGINRGVPFSSPVFNGRIPTRGESR